MTTKQVAKKQQIELLDSTYGVWSQSHVLTALAKIGPETVRVRITQNAYEEQSSALIDVLNGNREWTLLTAVVPAEFHKLLPSYVQVGPQHRKKVEDYATTLFHRGARILGLVIG